MPYITKLGGERKEVARPRFARPQEARAKQSMFRLPCRGSAFANWYTSAKFTYSYQFTFKCGSGAFAAGKPLQESGDEEQRLRLKVHPYGGNDLIAKANAT